MDKAALIRHEIEKRRAYNLAIGNPLFTAMAEEDIELLSFIDSLQEEPNTHKLKFNVGDTIKDKDGYEVTIESVGDDCYFVDRAQACIKFSTQDQWELVEEVSKNYALNNTPWDDCKDEIQESFKAGAKWQKEQMMAKAINGTITNAGGTFGYDVASFKFDDNHSFQVLLPADRKSKFGDKVKVIVIKED